VRGVCVRASCGRVAPLGLPAAVGRGGHETDEQPGDQMPGFDPLLTVVIGRFNANSLNANVGGDTIAFCRGRVLRNPFGD
jgi:hypothetical protein